MSEPGKSALNTAPIASKRKSITDYFSVAPPASSVSSAPSKAARREEGEEEEKSNLQCSECEDAYDSDDDDESLPKLEPNLPNVSSNVSNSNFTPTPEYIASLGTSKRRGCIGNKLKLCPFSFDNPCGHCLHRTIASSARAMSMWDFKKNVGLMPYYTMLCSGKKFKWKCVLCKHEWIASADNMIGKSNCNCPACNNKTKRGCCIATDCTSCTANNVFSNKRGMDMWNLLKNEGNDPRLISLGSHRICDWKCSFCKHEWQSTCNNVLGSNARGCPVCSCNTGIGNGLCLAQDCHYCQTNNITSSPRANTLWDSEKNVNKDPRLISLQSNKHFHWVCDMCRNKWTASANNVNGHQKSGCPSCVTDSASREFMKFMQGGEQHNHIIIREFRNNTCRDKNPLPFDFVVQNWMTPLSYCMFELDGGRHFYWKMFKMYACELKAKEEFNLYRKHDIYKMIWAVTHGYCLVRYLSSIIRQSTHDPSKWQQWIRNVHSKHIVPCFENKTPPVIVFPDSKEYRDMYEACVKADKRFEEWVVWEPLL